MFISDFQENVFAQASHILRPLGGRAAPPALQPTGLYIVLGLAVAHALECALFLGRLQAMHGPIGKHLAMTFILGVTYVFDSDDDDEDE